MEVVKDYPPMFDEIDQRFHVRGKVVFYTWGDKIYNPMGGHIPPEIMAHEAVHCRQQGDDIEGWWRRYIDEPAFRLDQEISAHVREYGFLCASGNRNERRGALASIAGRLSGPLYGHMITCARARNILREASTPISVPLNPTEEARPN